MEKAICISNCNCQFQGPMAIFCNSVFRPADDACVRLTSAGTKDTLFPSPPPPPHSLSEEIAPRAQSGFNF